jgi:ABC-type transport system involved in cytochrome bd biosynthesis fused ATPase/permease subunit
MSLDGVVPKVKWINTKGQLEQIIEIFREEKTEREFIVAAETELTKLNQLIEYRSRVDETEAQALSRETYTDGVFVTSAIFFSMALLMIVTAAYQVQDHADAGTRVNMVAAMFPIAVLLKLVIHAIFARQTARSKLAQLRKDILSLQAEYTQLHKQTLDEKDKAEKKRPLSPENAYVAPSPQNLGPVNFHNLHIHTGATPIVK